MNRSIDMAEEDEEEIEEGSNFSFAKELKNEKLSRSSLITPSQTRIVGQQNQYIIP